ncbi:MAG: RNA 3'-terminal phosphate cyclase, partial [Fimbriimonas sp.]
MSVLHIDGAQGEGSGGLLRTALAMAAITQQPVHIENVRGGSKYPGVDPEDLAILQILAKSTQADLKGAELGSDELLYAPKVRPNPVNLRIDDIRNSDMRGPNALIVLNTVLPVLARAGGYSYLEVAGETYGHHALSYDMFANATLALHRKFGIYAESTLKRAGFGREANGRVTLEIEPSAVQAVRWDDRGSFLGLQAVVTTGEMSPSVAGRAVSHLKKLGETSS